MYCLPKLKRQRGALELHLHGGRVGSIDLPDEPMHGPPAPAIAWSRETRWRTDRLTRTSLVGRPNLPRLSSSSKRRRGLRSSQPHASSPKQWSSRIALRFLNACRRVTRIKGIGSRILAHCPNRREKKP